MTLYNLISFLGLFVFLGLAWTLSADRRRMNWRLIAWGLGLQLLFGAFVFRLDFGRRVFVVINEVVMKVVEAALEGPKFLLGGLADDKATAAADLGYVLLANGLMTIVVFSALISLLYYFGLLQFIIRGFAWVFAKLMRISGAEALCAAGNIFVGVESAIMVRPYLRKMTRSELLTVLTAGMSTVASNVMAVYVTALKGPFPQIAGHLVSASILSAPAALMLSKILLPESGSPETLGRQVEVHYEREDSFFEAVINGANQGMQFVIGIAALLVAAVGLVAMLDLILGVAGTSLKELLGYAFTPFALAMGVPRPDVLEVARLVGQRVVVTEVPSYFDLAGHMAAGTIQPRSAVIATYALCGFAHIPSLAIFVGGVMVLAPERKKDLAQLGFRALLGSTLACMMTACIAGTFYAGGATVLGR